MSNTSVQTNTLELAYKENCSNSKCRTITAPLKQRTIAHQAMAHLHPSKKPVNESIITGFQTPGHFTALHLDTDWLTMLQCHISVRLCTHQIAGCRAITAENNSETETRGF